MIEYGIFIKCRKLTIMQHCAVVDHLIHIIHAQQHNIAAHYIAIQATTNFCNSHINLNKLLGVLKNDS